jgi:plastocyanin
MPGHAWNRAGVVALVAAFAAGCGGGGGDSQPNPSPLTIAKAPSESGDAQTGPVGQTLPNELRIVVTRNGAPEANATVTWSTSNGNLEPASGPTDAAGVATSRWTLGTSVGAQAAQAALQGATGSPVSFTATGTSTGPPPPPPPATAAVSVGNIFFQSSHNNTKNPAVDTVAVNGTVTWTWANTGSTEHSVLSTGTTSFTSSPTQPGPATYHFTFTQAGTYTYNCAVHGGLMTGQIVVR